MDRLITDNVFLGEIDTAFSCKSVPKNRRVVAKVKSVDSGLGAHRMNESTTAFHDWFYVHLIQ